MVGLEISDYLTDQYLTEKEIEINRIFTANVRIMIIKLLFEEEALV